jgi:hypothetical protein
MAVNTSAVSVSFYETTRGIISEDSLHEQCVFGERMLRRILDIKEM